jgi:hypothetical protein
MPATLFHYGIDSYLNDTGRIPSPSKTAGSVSEYERFTARGAMDLYYRKLVIVPGCKVALVPKSAVTFRSIAAEPMVNSYFQNGAGAYMVELLAKKTHMLDLRDQTRNQSLAKAGSYAGSLATIDLSSASDTISKSLARALLPRKWYQLFTLLRSPRYEFNGVTRKANKLSSMGNGFTFPLESALFYSIARAATVSYLVNERKLTLSQARRATESRGSTSQGLYEPSVYGDDIVIRSDASNAVYKALKLCGFWINSKKSYTQGLFRESCGHDYYCGDYVRPVFLKRKISLITQVITLINQLTHPEGLGWLTMRWGVHFPLYFKGLAALSHRFKGLSLTFGPFRGRSEDSFVCALIDDLRNRGHLSYDTGAQRWVYRPISVTPVLSRNVSELGYGLKALRRLEGGSSSRFSNTLYALVTRGKVKLKYPKKGSVAEGLASLPSVELGEVPENFEGWLANLVRYRELYPLLKGF